MKRRSLFALAPVAGLFLPLLGADLQTLLPAGEITDETPSLEAAFPDHMFINRIARAHGGMIDYEVRVYSEEPRDHEFDGMMWEVAIVVIDPKGNGVLSASLEAGGISTTPPNKNEFRAFRFSIHESLERTTVINIGRPDGMRVPFTRYKLPLKSIDHPKAH